MRGNGGLGHTICLGKCLGSGFLSSYEIVHTKGHTQLCSQNGGEVGDRHTMKEDSFP